MQKEEDAPGAARDAKSEIGTETDKEDKNGRLYDKAGKIRKIKHEQSSVVTKLIDLFSRFKLKIGIAIVAYLVLTEELSFQQ